MNALPTLRSLILTSGLLSSTTNVFASELEDYVQQCQSELQFEAYEIPELDCNDGEQFIFVGGGPFNDWLVYHRVNENVDLTAACRWGDPVINQEFGGQSTAFVSLELMIHNRETGGTCFFGARDTLTDGSGQLTNRPVSHLIVPPTDFSPSAYDPTVPAADYYWMQPSALNNKLLPSRDPQDGTQGEDFVRCVSCHSQGPYIASPAIVDELGTFGLLNDRHDTQVTFGTGDYYAVGSNSHLDPSVGNNTGHAFAEWNSIIYDNNSYNAGGQNDCTSCHPIADEATIGDLLPDPDVILNPSIRQLPLLASITSDIARFNTNGEMPPTHEDSDYRWMNLETPWDGIELETFAGAIDASNGQASSEILSNCGRPGYTEAHAVGLDAEYSFSSLEMSWIPDRLNTFNLKEGLLCLKSEQDDGTCADYETSYLCDGEWTNETLGYWFDTDGPSGNGDYEQRSRISGLCPNPMAIKTRFLVDGQYVEVVGPSDRLAQFSDSRLACNNQDQVDGECNNYVVRYRNCWEGPFNEYPAYVGSFWSGKLLTATNGSNGADVRGQPNNYSWDTQWWVIEEEVSTPYIRLRNKGTDTYLNVRGQQENAVVETQEIRDRDSQRWVMESVSGGGLVRFRNVWSGRYLTLRDTSNYSGVYSQSLNPSWESQKWSLSAF